jgi:hypothetical protein
MSFSSRSVSRPLLGARSGAIVELVKERKHALDER